MAAPQSEKLRGFYPTPRELVDVVVSAIVPLLPVQRGRTALRIVDPACGDGRFLAAVAERLGAVGADVELFGVDIDDGAIADARRLLGDEAHLHVADALTMEWTGERAAGSFDLVIGNPPFLSQLAAATSRRRASDRGGGAYADVAAEFLHLAVELAAAGGVVGLVLPQSIIASRDVGAIRADVERRADLVWSWWSPDRWFDASVIVCALGFRRRAGNSARSADDSDNEWPTWTDVILDALDVPPLPTLSTAGVVGDRGRCSADFRDLYYGLAPAVGDDHDGPPFVTTGVIDPLTCHWGERSVRFAKRALRAPRVDFAALAPKWRRWAAAMSTSKVLVANQSSVIECVADVDGELLPGVPVITVVPAEPTADAALAIAAVLTSPIATIAAWTHAAGTGLSARALRLNPRLIAALPWPAGPLDAAIAAARRGDVVGCGRAVVAAYGVAPPETDRLVDWWRSRLPDRPPTPTKERRDALA